MDRLRDGGHQDGHLDRHLDTLGADQGQVGGRHEAQLTHKLKQQ